MLIFLHILRFFILYGGGAYLLYAPFKEKLRLAPQKLIGVLVLLFVVLLGGHIALLLFISEVAAFLWLLIALPICGVLFLWSVEESTYKSILVLLLVVCYGAFICGYAVFISNLIFAEGVPHQILQTIGVLFIGGATYLLIHGFMVERMIPLVNLASSNDLKSVYFMPLFYIILQVVFFVFYSIMGQMSDLVYLIVLVTINAATYFLVVELLHILSISIDRTRMREEISTAEKLLELQKSQYASWVTQIEEVRRARHDLKHHIAMIQIFLDKDDKVGLQEHINNFQRTLPESAPLVLCKNIDVNAILLHYYDRARKENVKLELLANVEEDIAINSQDLAVVFGNCLENAFEACARMEPTAEKSVSLMAKPMGKGLALIIDNTFNGQVVKSKDIYLSSKRNNQEGVGLMSVKLIVQKYAGIISFETEGNLFMTSIRLGGKAVAKEVKGNES